MAIYIHKLFVAYLLFQLHLFPANIADFWQYNNCFPEPAGDSGSGNSATLNRTLSDNINDLLSEIGSKARNNNGFFNDTAGTDPNKVYGLVMCYADANTTSCNECLSTQNALQITRTCPESLDATFWAVNPNSCIVRYACNDNFFSKADTTVLYAVKNTIDFPDVELFTQARKTLLRRLITEVNRTKDLVASGEERINATAKIYGLLQCTRDLNHTECNRCLNEFVGQIGSVVANYSQGARLHGNSCFLRYEIYSFVPTENLGADPSIVPAMAPAPPSPGGNKKSHTTPIVAAAAGFATLLVMIAICIWIRRKCHLLGRTESALSLRDEMKRVTHDFLMYDLMTIRNATDNFSDKNKLGGGGFGPVYKGTLPDAQELAIKRLSANSNQGATEFKTEVNLLVRARHNNLVRLIGCCISENERILCYEFLPNGSLDKILFGPDDIKSVELDWNRRFKIIKGISRGLLYLHVESPLKIVHRDLKASNILLDKHMNPKISDFGLARLLDRDQTHKDTCKMAGTFGYMAPEYTMQGKFSDKSDVYSFGILVLEIVTGKSTHGLGLTSYVWKHWIEDNVQELKDQTLDEECTEEVSKCIHIAVLCLQVIPSNRPNMEAVANMLNSTSSVASLPSLPPPRFIWGADDSLFEDDENAVGNLSIESSVAGVEENRELSL